jgi:hypothetical protein
MKLFKQWWLVAVLSVLLTVVSIHSGSFAGYPLAALMWAEFFAWALISFAGLYACTLTGTDRQRVFSWARRLAGFAGSARLKWYHRLLIVTVMCAAGWKLTAAVYIAAMGIRLVLGPELRRTAA